ncbi:MAG: glucoamylase family protein, partial [Calditrichia bacterium]
QHRTFLYFVNEINPDNGLVKDRSTADSPASIAAVGFAIPVWAIGAEHGWITRQRAADLTRAAIHFFWTGEQNDDSLSSGFQGFFYHFLDMKTGKRRWRCELSTVDTAWLLAGLRFATQYFNRDEVVEKEIRILADSITYRANWDFFTLPDTGRDANTISMAWRPERGFNASGWTGYNEALLLYILAAGCGYPHIEDAWQGWLSTYKWMEPYPGLAHAAFPPLFGHQYSHLFVDFRGISDEFMREKDIDYFENSRRAVLTQQQYAIDNPPNWTGYDSLTWGLTACDGPGPQPQMADRKFYTYRARGTSGPNFVWDDDGTIAPTAAGGSVPFAPEITIPTLLAFYNDYGDEGLWGPYGFYDAFNPTLDWFDSDYLGIDQGPIVLMIENYRNGFVWEYCMKDPLIQKGLDKLGFREVQE